MSVVTNRNASRSAGTVGSSSFQRPGADRMQIRVYGDSAMPRDAIRTRFARVERLTIWIAGQTVNCELVGRVLRSAASLRRVHIERRDNDWDNPLTLISWETALMDFAETTTGDEEPSPHDPDGWLAYGIRNHPTLEEVSIVGFAKACPIQQFARALCTVPNLSSLTLKADLRSSSAGVLEFPPCVLRRLVLGRGNGSSGSSRIEGTPWNHRGSGSRRPRRRHGLDETHVGGAARNAVAAAAVHAALRGPTADHADDPHGDPGVPNGDRTQQPQPQRPQRPKLHFLCLVGIVPELDLYKVILEEAYIVRGSCTHIFVHYRDDTFYKRKPTKHAFFLRDVMHYNQQQQQQQQRGLETQQQRSSGRRRRSIPGTNIRIPFTRRNAAASRSEASPDGPVGSENRALVGRRNRDNTSDPQEEGGRRRDRHDHPPPPPPPPNCEFSLERLYALASIKSWRDEVSLETLYLLVQENPWICDRRSCCGAADDLPPNGGGTPSIKTGGCDETEDGTRSPFSAITNRRRRQKQGQSNRSNNENMSIQKRMRQVWKNLGGSGSSSYRS